MCVEEHWVGGDMGLWKYRTRVGVCVEEHVGVGGVGVCVEEHVGVGGVGVCVEEHVGHCQLSVVGVCIEEHVGWWGGQWWRYV